MLTDIVTFFLNLYTVDFYDLSTKFCSEACKLFWFSIVKFMIGVERWSGIFFSGFLSTNSDVSSVAARHPN